MDTPDITYLSSQDVKENTLVESLKGAGDDDIEFLITTAEDQIDAFVGKQKHHIYDTNIDRVFPRSQDYRIDGTSLGPVEYPQIPIIPYDVQKACLRQVEWLYTQWWPNRATDDLPVQHDAAEVDIGGDGTITEKPVSGGMDLAAASLCPQARLLLKPYRSRGAQISVSRPGGLLGTAALSSREGTYQPSVE